MLYFAHAGAAVEALDPDSEAAAALTSPGKGTPPPKEEDEEEDDFAAQVPAPSPGKSLCFLCCHACSSRPDTSWGADLDCREACQPCPLLRLVMHALLMAVDMVGTVHRIWVEMTTSVLC